MSKEYIDREGALSAIKQAFEKGERPSLYIKCIPAADVAEVRHGWWIDKGWDGDTNWQIDGRGSCWRVHECSECNAQQKMETTNYCPYCGALMDKEEVCKENTKNT